MLSDQWILTQLNFKLTYMQKISCNQCISLPTGGNAMRLSATKKAGLKKPALLTDSPALATRLSWDYRLIQSSIQRPVAFRPTLADGLAFYLRLHYCLYKIDS
jgi:hypothetical protein